MNKFILILILIFAIFSDDIAAQSNEVIISDDSLKGNIELLKSGGIVYELFGLTELKEDTTYSRIDTVYFVIAHENQTFGKEEKIKTLITYEKGVKTKVVGYFDNGKKFKETYFNDGKKFNGMSTQWYKNGNKFTQTYYENGKAIFPYLSWYENGILKSYSDFDNEVNKGVIKNWYPNGKLKTEMIAIDTTSGCMIERQYHEEGKLREEFIINCGIQSYIRYNILGEIKIEGFIVNAIWNSVGKWKEYYDNGKKKKEMYFDENIPNFKIGKWSYWDEKENLIKEEFYENNELIKTKNYTPINRKIK